MKNFSFLFFTSLILPIYIFLKIIELKFYVFIQGVLVVNVTWRGKTYVGTLLDSTKQDWACPR
jgi:hypothetical protein